MVAAMLATLMSYFLLDLLRLLTGSQARCIEALNHGDSIVLFPEDTRGNAEEPQAFKAGLYNLALKFPNIELVPAWINNLQRVMPKGEVAPVLCSVTVGASIQLMQGEERRAFLDRGVFPRLWHAVAGQRGGRAPVAAGRRQRGLRPVPGRPQQPGAGVFCGAGGANLHDRPALGLAPTWSSGEANQQTRNSITAD